MDRRSFLRTGLFATAILSASGVALSMWPVRRRAGVTTPKLKVLSEASFWTLIAFAERVAPAGADHLQVARAIDQALTYISVESQQDLNTLLGLLENGVVGLLLGLSPKPFSQRSPEAQDATILDWANSSLTLRRGGFQALRKLCLAAHFGEKENWKGMGYQGPPATGGLFYDDSKAGAR